jgi:hypothetical protein
MVWVGVALDQPADGEMVFVASQGDLGPTEALNGQPETETIVDRGIKDEVPRGEWAAKTFLETLKTEPQVCSEGLMGPPVASGKVPLELLVLRPRGVPDGVFSCVVPENPAAVIAFERAGSIRVSDPCPVAEDAGSL